MSLAHKQCGTATLLAAETAGRCPRSLPPSPPTCPTPLAPPSLTRNLTACTPSLLLSCSARSTSLAPPGTFPPTSLSSLPRVSGRCNSTPGSASLPSHILLLALDTSSHFPRQNSSRSFPSPPSIPLLPAPDRTAPGS